LKYHIQIPLMDPVSGEALAPCQNRQVAGWSSGQFPRILVMSVLLSVSKNVLNKYS